MIIGDGIFIREGYHFWLTSKFIDLFYAHSRLKQVVFRLLLFFFSHHAANYNRITLREVMKLSVKFN